MKKLMLSLILAGISSTAFAADRLDGCGLGWQVTDKKTYTATTTRGTTNSVVPATFGMTTGTLGCDKLDIGKNDKEAADYVATNFESLKSELALGQGEYVTNLSAAMGCKSSANAVGAKLQQSYNNVVAPASTAVELYKNIRSEVRNVCI